MGGRRIVLLLGGALAGCLALLPTGGPTGARAADPAAEGRAAIVVLLHGVSFEQLLSMPTARELASRPGGGAALMVPQQPVPEVLAALGRVVLAGPGRRPSVVEVSPPVGEPGHESGAAVRAAVDEAVRSAPPGALLLIAGATPSREMVRHKDGVLPLVAAGLPPASAPSSRAPHALTSQATRREGVISSLDLAPTVLLALGRTIPGGLPGAAIEATTAPAPLELHLRYLQMRRLTVPVQAAAWIYVAVAASALVVLLHFRARVPAAILASASWVGLSVPPLAVALFAAGHLPSLSYATVVPFVLLVTVVATIAVVPLARRGTLAPAAAMGAAVLAYFVGEALAGFTGALTPLLGGSQLDGGRFFGVPNAVEGLLVGAALYLAATWATWPGVALLGCLAFFMGLPRIGADVGGAVVGFAAAGLWLALRRRGAFDLAGLAVAGIVTVAGTAMVLLAHRYWPGTPTHATAFVEAGGGGLAATIGHRVTTGLRLIATNPFAAIPAVGALAMVVVSLRPPPSIAGAFHRFPRWRDAVIVLSLAGVVALVANDTGPAAAGLAFGLALGGALYVSLRVGSGKMEHDEPAAAALD